MQIYQLLEPGKDIIQEGDITPDSTSMAFANAKACIGSSPLKHQIWFRLITIPEPSKPMEWMPWGGEDMPRGGTEGKWVILFADGLTSHHATFPVYSSVTSPPTHYMKIPTIPKKSVFEEWLKNKNNKDLDAYKTELLEAYMFGLFQGGEK